MHDTQVLHCVLYVPRTDVSVDDNAGDDVFDGVHVRQERSYVYLYFDFVAKQSNDHHFVRRALLELFSHPLMQKYKRILLFSDGGVITSKQSVYLFIH